MATTTRERIVDEAMRLFGEQGYRATTIVQIETAAGLTPGAGGIYHHFATKEALLAAGVERHLQRLAALRDIRGVFTGLGDVTAELTVTARYILTELDSEAELLRILTVEARNRPELLRSAAEQLIGTTVAQFAGWLAEHARAPMSDEQAAAFASLSLGGLISTRVLAAVLDLPQAADDEALVRAWVALLRPLLVDARP
jgi:AcrR family transcriptional regulator